MLTLLATFVLGVIALVFAVIIVVYVLPIVIALTLAGWAIYTVGAILFTLLGPQLSGLTFLGLIVVTLGMAGKRGVGT